MGIVDKVSRGISLTVDSVQILRDNPRLAIFPAAGGASAGLFLLLFLGGGFGLLGALGSDSGLAPLAILFLAYMGSTFLTTLFTAGLVHESREVFRGNEPDLRRGLEAAWEVKLQLLAWAFISATVGIIINMIEQSNSTLGKIIAKIFSVAWTIMTFFVVPVAVFEQSSVGDMFSRSADTVRDTWGEAGVSLIGSKVVGVIVFALLAVVSLLVSGLLDAVINAGGLLFLLLVVSAVAAYLVVSTTQGIIRTSLYVYATEGTVASSFDENDLETLG